MTLGEMLAMFATRAQLERVRGLAARAAPPLMYLNWTDFKLSSPGGVPKCAFDPAQFMPSGTKEYMVSYTAGSDANAGTSWAAPLKSVSAALAKSDWDIITIDEAAGYGGTSIYYGAVASRRASTVTRGGIIRTRGGGKVTLANSRNPTSGSTITPQTWVLYSGAAYSTNSPTVTGGGALVVDLGIIDSAGFPAVYAPVASAAAVASTPGSCYRDAATSTMYVQTADSRSIVGDNNIIICDSSNCFAWDPAAPGSTLWTENIRFVGGGRAFRAQQTTVSNYGRNLVVHKNCDFCGGATSVAYSIVGGFDVYLIDSTCTGSVQDAFNYHYASGNPTQHPRVFELRCKTGYTGYDNSGANNGSTTHAEGGSGGLIVRALGTYYGSQGRTIHDGGLYSLIFGCTIKAPTGPKTDTMATVRAGAGNTMWLDRCSIEHGALNDADVYVESAGAMSLANMSLSGLTTYGTIGSYTGL